MCRLNLFHYYLNEDELINRQKAGDTNETEFKPGTMHVEI